MPPVALDCPRWRSLRRAFRLLTSLAVAAALALGGALAGDPSAGDPPALAGDPAAGGPPVHAGSLRVDLTAADRVGPFVGRPAGWSAPTAGSAVEQDDPDGTATPPATGPTGGVPVPAHASPPGGSAPVRPLAGADVGAAGSRAPPRR